MYFNDLSKTSVPPQSLRPTGVLSTVQRVQGFVFWRVFSKAMRVMVATWYDSVRFRFINPDNIVTASCWLCSLC